jgi:multidrug efflux pump subunit AcrA (membrane-fusion protein)
MDAAIKQFRLKLGIDKPAVDVQALAQARTLVAQATRLFEGGSAAQLTEAQTRVQRALALDPKNRAAQELSDRISLRITNFVATLTPSQRGELNDMVDLIRTQRNLEALARITEFKAKYPAVANDTYVREVERRIKAVN